MNTTETDRFVSNVLGGLWPDWTPTDEEMRVWYGVMSHYDYETARTATQQYFSDSGGNYKRPKPAGIIAKAKVLIQNANLGRQESKEILTNVFIECLDPPERNPKLKNKRKAVYAISDILQRDHDHVLRCADTMRRKFEQLYGGHWITVQTKPPEDNGLRGEQARQKAMRDIMNGPDTKTKRWLTKYLNRDKPKKKKQPEQEPVLIGAVIEDEIPF